MKLSQSKFLNGCHDKVRELVKLLAEKYEYASILATDVSGSQFTCSQKGKSINPYGFSERGFVSRIYTQQGYQEYSFNELDDVRAVYEKIVSQLRKQDDVIKLTNVEKYQTPLAFEEEISGQFASQINDSFQNTDKREILDKLQQISDENVRREHVIECSASYTEVLISKMFVSSRRDLMQTYGYSMCNIMMLAHKDGKTNYNRVSSSQWKGPELIDEVNRQSEQCYRDLMSLFEAENLVPGEYTVICPPESSGIIAHEAFGHGLEMDMFVKNRAVAAFHMQEKIASDVTNMYDGATNIKDTASFFFDDEGTLGSETTILKDGYLVNGMCDLLSAVRLGVKPTGNGRRESYKRKAYTRMTNTYFGPGNVTLDEMIATTDYGFIIDGAQSGMEDPKNWGIQCILARAKEIKDGKLTGKVFTPVILSGYVPDLLANISQVGHDIETNGCGYCGKGYKEWVVVSDGGPYLKTKVRLG